MKLLQKDLGNDGVALSADVGPGALNISDLIGRQMGQRVNNLVLRPAIVKF